MALSERELGARARALVRSRDRGSLATVMRDTGWPYASLVMTACDMAGNPLMMISELAEHTQNILSDDRVSLLVDGTGGLDNPLTGTRVTLVGSASKTTDPQDMARYVARHEDAAQYAGFADFALYRLDVERVHTVAGFGAIHWIEKPGYAMDFSDSGNLIAAEADIISHMNTDHRDALQLYAAKLLGLPEIGTNEEWIMTGIDPEGCDMRRAGAVARVDFDAPVTTPDDARTALVKLVAKARKIG